MIIAISGKAQNGKDTIANMITYCVFYHTNKPFVSKPFGLEGLEHFLGFFNIEASSNFFIERFADSLKEASSAILGCPKELLEDIVFKNSPIDWLECNGQIKGEITVRQLLQHLGSAVREYFGDSFWAQRLVKHIKDDAEKNTVNFLIPDLRYKIELETLKKINTRVLTIRVNRPGVPQMLHSSEIDLDDYKNWDYVIENDGTLESLLYKVRDFCKAFNLI